MQIHRAHGINSFVDHDIGADHLESVFTCTGMCDLIALCELSY
jgi:phage tail tube protein FII